jgi:glucoamylase
MISEQLWDADDLPNGKMKKGFPTGAAMPLCWSHAEYITLVRSRHDGVCFDRVEPAWQRYVVKPVESRFEMWTMRHQIRRVPKGKILRLVVANDAAITWSSDKWVTVKNLDTTRNDALGLWHVDFATENLREGAVLEFTFFWKKALRWEGRNFSVTVE